MLTPEELEAIEKRLDFADRDAWTLLEEVRRLRVLLNPLAGFRVPAPKPAEADPVYKRIVELVDPALIGLGSRIAKLEKRLEKEEA